MQSGSAIRRRETAASCLVGRRAACAALAVVLILGACRSTRPAAGETPLAPGTPLTSIRTIRSLMRIRVTSGEQSQSFRSQLLVRPASHTMMLSAYTPIGTEAMTLYASGDSVIFLNHLDHTAWRGTATELSDRIGLLGGVSPTDWALAVLGYPSQLEDVVVTVEPAGVAPAQHVALTRGNRRVEVTNLEVLASDVTPQPPLVPAGYRCCVLPVL